MRIIRLACLAYFVGLTFLLLTPEVGVLLGLLRFVPHTPGGIGLHFTAFFGLGILVAASRFPVRRLWLVVFLSTYAVVAELLQFISPPRVVDAVDALENLLGLATGLVLWDLAAKRGARKRETQCQKQAASDSS